MLLSKHTYYIQFKNKPLIIHRQGDYCVWVLVSLTFFQKRETQKARIQ